MCTKEKWLNISNKSFLMNNEYSSRMVQNNKCLVRQWNFYSHKNNSLKVNYLFILNGFNITVLKVKSN